jgi:hypothetical protein
VLLEEKPVDTGNCQRKEQQNPSNIHIHSGIICLVF